MFIQAMNIRMELCYTTDNKRFLDPRKFTFRKLGIFLTQQITNTLFVTFFFASAYVEIVLK